MKNGRRGHGPSCFHRIMYFCSSGFLQVLQEGKGLRIGLPVALGEGHGAEVLVSR